MTAYPVPSTGQTWVTASVAPAGNLSVIRGKGRPVLMPAWLVQELRDEAGGVHGHRVVPSRFVPGQGLVADLEASRVIHDADPF
ncbi:hypothetical protein [Rhodococcus aetherivorans]|uniref:hypothetical protein n=1 Tax=Rhodococcus aetherivorans TaxID=191292 RepID=UPI00045C598B|nr:hypothetical protein [Rhodococcus aetherivorans]KDE13856.1 hypothetical protein N505_0108495 [Rhodococcus aetherivorans]